MLTVRIYGIAYDTDGEDIALPEELVVEVKDHEDVEDELSDIISERTGFCHKGFFYEVLN